MHCCEAFRRHVHQQVLASRQLPMRGRVGTGACIVCGWRHGLPPGQVLDNHPNCSFIAAGRLIRTLAVCCC